MLKPFPAEKMEAWIVDRTSESYGVLT